MKILMQFWKGGGGPPSHKNVFFFRGIFWESCPATKPRFLGDFGANEDLANLRIPWYPKQQPCFFVPWMEMLKTTLFYVKIWFIIQLKQPFRNWMAIRFQVWIILGIPTWPGITGGQQGQVKNHGKKNPTTR